MYNPNCNTEHKEYQHITSEKAHEIEVRLKDKWTKYAIAKHLDKPYTIHQELNRPRYSMALNNRTAPRYSAEVAEKMYLKYHNSSVAITAL